MSASSGQSLRKATAVGLTLIVLLLVFNMLVSLWNTGRLIENGHKVAHTQRVLTTLEEVLAQVTEAETSERGFLITGDENYLIPYRKAIKRTGETLQRLKQLTADDQAQPGQVRALQARVSARFDELQQAIAAQRSGGFDAARHSVSTNHGRELMDEMLDLVGQMKAREEEALELRSAESQRSAQVTMVTDFVGSLMGIAMVCVAVLLFRRELALRQTAQAADQRLAAIVESSDDAIVSKSLDGLIVSWNSGARRIYDYSAEEVVGHPITLLCPPERADEVQYNLERVRRGEHIEHFETTRVRKDGQRIDVSLRISPLKDSNGAVIGASAIARDVTERKLLQREVLEIAAREQQRIGQDLHDGTGQELTGLAMLAERLSGDLERQSLPQGASAASIVEGLEQALRHVRDLSKGLVPVELDADGLMAALAELATRTSELPGVVCTFACDQPVQILDNQAATHLYRLSQEAVTNALKHGHATEIVIKLTNDRDCITLQIQDNGEGFDDGRSSAGIGLRIMAYRAELIRGHLAIGKATPRGTVITCKLPRQQVAWTQPFERSDRSLLPL
jgi:PAS domain S-box-containing protein